MDQDLQKDLRDYAWKYFSYHADQRLKTFNFFLLFLTAGIAGLLAHAEHLDEPMFSIVGGLGLLLLSFLFWKLDRRHRTLVHVAENALMVLEDQLMLGEGMAEVKIFHAEVKETKKLRRSSGRFRYLSCTECFNMMFFVVTALGIYGAAKGVLIWLRL